MPSFSDSIFLFVLALLLFGPKKLPVLARQVGKWMAEFRRASNEFKMQMEEELRLSEQAERQAKIAAIEAAAPPLPALESSAATEATSAEGETTIDIDPEDPHPRYAPAIADSPEPLESFDGVRPIPIAVSGDLKIMPPSTGLPVAQTASESSALNPVLDSIPSTEPTEEQTTETAAHGD